MNDLKNLEKKISELENRVKKLEEIILSTQFNHDRELMDRLYNTAKGLVIKHKKASIIFLQRKLLIDFERASSLLEELEKNGIISPDMGLEPRRILVDK